MSFYNNKSTKYRMCTDGAGTPDPAEVAELLHSFGRFSKYFQCDNYYANLNTPSTTPEMSKKVGCYNGVSTLGRVISCSESTQNRAAMTVLDKPRSGVCSRTHDASDRAQESITTLNVVSRGNSVKNTVTSHRPGAQSAPGTGVDVKHNSYNRHTMRMRGQLLNKQGC
jgi:hypothetical protein